MFSRSMIFLALLAVSSTTATLAFTPSTPHHHHQPQHSTSTLLFASTPPPPSSSSSRRTLLSNMFFLSTLAATTTATSVVMLPQPASATYTAYSQREKDWEERQKTGQIQFSNARALRAQLQEIVPQNSEGSKIFCPNGMSSAVSPLQENKCGDQLAMPSVFGRTEDVVGNSIPGFSSSKYSVSTSSQQLSASDVGGFPKYK